MKVITTTFISVLALFSASFASAQEGDKIVGVYRALGVDTQLWSEIQFTKCGDRYEGKIIWVEQTTDGNGKPLTDINNPDPKLRSTPANKIRVVWDIFYDAQKDIWTGGKIYNPMDGKTYDVQISFDTPNKLKVRGYIGKPLLGKTFYWNKKN